MNHGCSNFWSTTHPQKQVFVQIDIVALGKHLGRLGQDRRAPSRIGLQPLGIAFRLIKGDQLADRVLPGRPSNSRIYFDSGKQSPVAELSILFKGTHNILDDSLSAGVSLFVLRCGHIPPDRSTNRSRLRRFRWTQPTHQPTFRKDVSDSSRSTFLEAQWLSQEPSV